MIIDGLKKDVDESDEWSDEDISDMTAASMKYAAATEDKGTKVLEWLSEAERLQEAIRQHRGADLPDSTPDISEDRRR